MLWFRFAFCLGIALVPGADAKCELDAVMELFDGTMPTGSELKTAKDQIIECVTKASTFEYLSNKYKKSSESILEKLKSLNPVSWAEAWDEAKALVKKFWESLVEAFRLRSRRFLDGFNERLENAPPESSDYGALFDKFTPDDWNDFKVVVEDYMRNEGIEETEDPDDPDDDEETKRMLSLNLALGAEITASSSGRRLQGLSEDDKEAAMRIGFDAEVSASIELKVMKCGCSKGPGWLQLKAKCKNEKKFDSDMIELAREIFDKIKTSLEPSMQNKCEKALEALEDDAEACKEKKWRRFLMKIFNFGLRWIVAEQEGKVDQMVAGGYLDLSFQGGATYSEVNSDSFTAEMSGIVAGALGGKVQQNWVVVTVEQICQAEKGDEDEDCTCRRPSRHKDGRRRSPKQGDGRRRRRTKKQGDRDENDNDGRRRHHKKHKHDHADKKHGDGRRRACTCQYHHDRRLRGLFHDEVDLDAPEALWAWNASLEAPKETSYNQSRLFADSGVGLNATEEKGHRLGSEEQGRRLGPSETVCTRSKGKTAVKAYYEVNVPAILEESATEVRQMARFKVKVNTKIKTRLQQSSWNAKVDLKAEASVKYVERPRTPRAQLKGAFLSKYNKVEKGMDKIRKSFRRKQIKDYDAEAKASFLASIAVFEDEEEYQSSSTEIKLGAKASAKLKVVKKKVESDEDLSDEDSYAMAKFQAMASWSVNWGKKVRQSPEATKFKEYYDMCISEAVEFGADFWAEVRSAYFYIKDSLTDKEQTDVEAIMDKLRDGDDLNTDEKKTLKLTIKGGMEVKVSHTEKERADFAAEVAARLSLTVMGPTEKAEFTEAFSAAAKLFQDCEETTKVTTTCEANECCSINTQFRDASDSMDTFCKRGCENDDGSLLPECSPDSPEADRWCSCCSEKTELLISDECQEIETVWELVLAGDFTVFTDKDEKVIRKVVRKGKSWFDKKQKSFRSSVARKYSQAEDEIMNTMDWSEVTDSAKTQIKEAIGKVKKKKNRVWNILSRHDFQVLDDAEKGVDCGCQEVTDKQKLVLRGALDISVKLELAETEGYKAKKIKSKVKITGINKAELETDEARMALRSAFQFRASASGSNTIVRISERATERRLCEHGRCLAEVTQEIESTVDSWDTVGDKDETVSQDIDDPNNVDLTNSLRTELKAAGVEGADGVAVTGVSSEVETCEEKNPDDCLPAPIEGEFESLSSASRTNGMLGTIVSAACLLLTRRYLQ